jgi:prepilin-type processing-associated H-X9-DG protein
MNHITVARTGGNRGRIKSDMPDQDLPQPLDYHTPENRKGSGQKVIVIVVITMALTGLLLFTVLLPPLASTRASSNLAKCESNMHQIGLAIIMYQNDHNQNYPNSLPELLEEQITPGAFVCPSSNDTASTGATTQAIAADWAKPGHLSYIYLGKGLNDKTAMADTVVLYEPMSNHAGEGMNVLFGDGHTDWVNATVGAKIIAAAATGKLPITCDPNTGIVSTAQPAK